MMYLIFLKSIGAFDSAARPFDVTTRTIAETRSRHPSAGDIARGRIPAAAASIHERQAGRRRGRGI